MSVAPLIPPHESSPAGTHLGNTAARPKRISPPAHWKDAAPAAAPKKPASKTVIAVPQETTKPATRPIIVHGRFAVLLAVGIVALNAVLLWLFPLPRFDSIRHETPAFSHAPITSEASELPVWLRP